MPAIHLARLRQQSAGLVDHFDRPQQFVRLLHEILEAYADRVHRPGQAGEPAPLIQAYRVPAPMLRHIAMQLDESCREKPLEAVAICDALWEESFLETRLLAAALLGQTGDLPPQTILTRVETWAAHTSEDRHLHALVNQALSPILHSHSDLVLEHAGIWLVSENLSLNVTSMRTLISLASDPAFDNLPAILLLITPYIRKAALPIRPDVLDLLAALARRSPRETAFFLRQNFESPDNPDTAWLARQTLQHFPEDVQTSLRNSLRQLNS